MRIRLLEIVQCAFLAYFGRICRFVKKIQKNILFHKQTVKLFMKNACVILKIVSRSVYCLIKMNGSDFEISEVLIEVVSKNRLKNIPFCCCFATSMSFEKIENGKMIWQKGIRCKLLCLFNYAMRYNNITMTGLWEIGIFKFSSHIILFLGEMAERRRNGVCSGQYCKKINRKKFLIFLSFVTMWSVVIKKIILIKLYGKKKIGYERKLTLKWDQYNIVYYLISIKPFHL